MKETFRHSLFWGMLLPLLVIGVISSIVLNRTLAPPLAQVLKKKIDITVHHATNMAITICEERFADLLELRMEANPEMNTTSKKEALEEIKNISLIFPNIRIMVMDPYGNIKGASMEIPDKPMGDLLDHLSSPSRKEEIYSIQLWGEPVIAYSQYFPFWRWQIVTFIPKDEYLKPIQKAEYIVAIGIFSTLLIVVFTISLLFLWKVNKPLKEIIQASDEVSRGNLQPLIKVRGRNEIARVANAFNAMVEGLAKDRDKIELILKDLKESEEKYRVLTENSLAIILMLQKGHFFYSNTAMSNILHYEEDKLKGIKFSELAMDKWAMKVEQRILALEKKEKQIQHFEAPFQSRTGEEVWLEILATALPYHGKEAVLIHGIDITAKKQMQKEQEKLQEKLTRIEKMEAVGALAGGVAHDLNNILGGIVGYPNLLLLEMDKNNPVYAPLKTIQKSGERASAIVQDMLTLTRRSVMVTKVVHLNTIIDDYLTSPEFDTLTGFHAKVQVKTDLAADLMFIDGSAMHLNKTIMNLVINGFEAMSDGGTLHLISENRYVDKPFGNYEQVKEGEYVTLSISDNGEGIAAADLEKIFEPFYTKKKMGRSGTGLGMSVVWGTVKDHKGYIEVQSIVGKGTTFTLFFPATRKQPVETLLEFDIKSYRGKGQTILVVDDVYEQRLIASAMLEKLGYVVSIVESGEKALQYLKEHSVDLVLLDMIMDPGIDGLDTYRGILDLNPDQKSVIASGYSETARVKMAQKLGAGPYVRKPYVLETLAVVIKNELHPTS